MAANNQYPFERPITARYIMKFSYQKKPTLPSLAPEIVHAISKELRLSDVKQLRLTCKTMSGLLTSRMFWTLDLQITRMNMKDGVQKIEALSRSHAVTSAVRELSIGSLSPLNDPTHLHYSIYDSQINEWVHVPFPTPPPEVAVAEERLNQHLFNTVTSMRGLYRVKWTPGEYDGQYVYRHIMDALRSLPNLRCLEIHFAKFKIPLELDMLKGLDELVVSTVKSTPLLQDDILENLANAIAQNPDLKSLTVSGIPHFGRPEATRFQSLHQLFKYCPTTAPPLRLRSLKLKSFLVRLDDINIRHLQCLTTLSITQVDDPNYVSPRLVHRGYFLDEKRQPLIQERKLYGSGTEEIWQKLMLTGLRLEKVVVDRVPKSLLDYLSSYSGLKELSLIAGGFDEGSTSDAMAVRFFDSTLKNHAISLEILRVLPHYEGQWCFSSRNSNQISTLTKLRHLAISIKLSDLEVVTNTSNDQAPLLSQPDAVTLLIDTTLHCMPNIQSIDIRSSMLESHRGAKCATISGQYSREVYKAILECIARYSAPLSCQRLPTLETGFTEIVFVGMHTTLTSRNDDETHEVSSLQKYIEITPRSVTKRRRLLPEV